MLSVDSPRWAELEHAYGDATDTPSQLYELLERQNYGDDPNDVLFGCLCHQGTVYTATYAAVPHVVNAISTQSTNSKIWLFTFLGKVAISSDAAPIPDDLRAAYLSAMSQAAYLVMDVGHQPGIPGVDYYHLLSSVPALHGLPIVHEVVEWMLTADEICGLCKSCGEEFSIYCQSTPFEAQHVRQHPTLGPKRGSTYPDNIGIAGTAQGPKTRVCPHSDEPAGWDGSIREDNAMSWLISLATKANHPLVIDRTRALFGSLDCPNCKKRISLWHAALHERER